MKGNNTLLLNHATIIEALQEYFDKRTTEEGRFIVLGIKTNNHQYDNTVEVSTTTEEVNGG